MLIGFRHKQLLRIKPTSTLLFLKPGWNLDAIFVSFQGCTSSGGASMGKYIVLIFFIEIYLSQNFYSSSLSMTIQVFSGPYFIKGRSQGQNSLTFVIVFCNLIYFRIKNVLLNFLFLFSIYLISFSSEGQRNLVKVLQDGQFAAEIQGITKQKYTSVAGKKYFWMSYLYLGILHIIQARIYIAKKGQSCLSLATHAQNSHWLHVC